MRKIEYYCDICKSKLDFAALSAFRNSPIEYTFPIVSKYDGTKPCNCMLCSSCAKKISDYVATLIEDSHKQ